MPSSSESPVIARFFKVMMPGFHTKLRLPVAFCMKLKGDIPEEAFLTSCKGTWRVEIGQCSEGSICFLEGWNSFVNKHDLKIEDFVVFEQTARVHYDVTVFDSNGSTKEFPVEVLEEESSAPKITKRGRGRPRKRAACFKQKGLPTEFHEAEASSGPKIDQRAREVSCMPGGRGRPRKRIASPKQRESSVEIVGEKAPAGRNPFGHTIENRRRGRSRKSTESLKQKGRMQYSMKHEFIPFENEFCMEINEDKQPYGKYVRKHTSETRGRLFNGAAPGEKQNHFVKKIEEHNFRRHMLYIPMFICSSYRMSEKTSISLRGPSEEWHEVSVRPHPKGRLCMKNGWREFCTSNNLQAGDICSFKIIRRDSKASSNNIMMHVKIFKTRSVNCGI